MFTRFLLKYVFRFQKIENVSYKIKTKLIIRKGYKKHNFALISKKLKSLPHEWVPKQFFPKNRLLLENFPLTFCLLSLETRVTHLSETWSRLNFRKGRNQCTLPPPILFMGALGDRDTGIFLWYIHREEQQPTSITYI